MPREHDVACVHACIMYNAVAVYICVFEHINIDTWGGRWKIHVITKLTISPEKPQI